MSARFPDLDGPITWNNVRTLLDVLKGTYGGGFVVEMFSQKDFGRGGSFKMGVRVVWRCRVGGRVVDHRAAYGEWPHRDFATMPGLIHDLAGTLNVMLDEEGFSRRAEVEVLEDVDRGA